MKSQRIFTFLILPVIVIALLIVILVPYEEDELLSATLSAPGKSMSTDNVTVTRLAEDDLTPPDTASFDEKTALYTYSTLAVEGEVTDFYPVSLKGEEVEELSGYVVTIYLRYVVADEEGDDLTPGMTLEYFTPDLQNGEEGIPLKKGDIYVVFLGNIGKGRVATSWRNSFTGVKADLREIINYYSLPGTQMLHKNGSYYYPSVYTSLDSAVGGAAYDGYTAVRSVKEERPVFHNAIIKLMEDLR